MNFLRNIIKSHTELSARKQFQFPISSNFLIQIDFHPNFANDSKIITNFERK